ncbi:MAG TPA: hypothetical protein VLC09_13485 [Polyangiaceae bacterium]|nr:hypothetical protein [Polyangiaceae bacterium]
MSSFLSARRHSWFSILVGLVLFTLATSAWAGGRIVWKSTTMKENPETKAWRLDLEIHLTSKPDVAHVPMKFEFVPVAYYERSMQDGSDKVQERTVPLTGQQALIESVDVGFMDAGSGETQSRTRFSFRVTRAHGYEAGEYKVTIRDTRNGQQVGTVQTLKLQGENEVIDRRSMVFQPSDKKKKKEEEAKPAEAESAPAAAAEPEEPAAPAEAPAASEPPPVEGRPGGGCHHGPSHGEHLSWMFFGLLAASGLWLRRRA